MLAHAEVNYPAFIRTRFEVAAFLDVGVVRDAEISRAANQHRQVRREGVDYFTARHARRHRLRILEIRQVRFPIRGQFAFHHRAPLLAQIRMLLLVVFNQRIPFRFLSRATINRFTKMIQSFIGNVELFVFRPAEMSLRFTNCVAARRIAVRLARARRRHSEADDCLN